MAFTAYTVTNHLYTSGANLTVARSVNAAATLLVVVIQRRDNSNTSTVTYGGQSMTLVPNSRANNADGETSEIYYLVNPPTGSNNLIVTPAATGGDFRVGVADFSGVNTSDPIDVGNGNTGATGDGTVSLTGVDNDSLIVAGHISEDGSAPTTPTNYTVIHNTDEGTWSTGSAYRILSGGAGNHTITWGGGRDDEFAASAAAFKVAPSGTETNDERAAKITGALGSNSERAAKITGQYPASALVQSTKINTGDTGIASAILHLKDSTTPSDSSISGWQMSADGGSNWENITPGVLHNFSNIGSDLRWRATLNASTDRQSQPVISEVAIVWLFVGDTVGSERAAKITGQESAAAERAAKITGQDTAASERAAKIHGVDTAASERAAKVTGQDSAADERSAKIHGQVLTADERAAKIHGVDTTAAERAAKITGQLTAADERSAKIHGQDTVGDERAAKIHGVDTTADERAAKITGSLGSADERAAKISGEDTAATERAAKIHGVDTTNDERAAKITGEDTAAAERAAKITGEAAANAERAAKITGALGSSSERGAKITGRKRRIWIS